MVPKYCFRVETVYRSGTQQHTHTSNHEVANAAWEARNTALRKPGTVRITVLMVIDETTRGEHAQDIQG